MGFRFESYRRGERWWAGRGGGAVDWVTGKGGFLCKNG